MRILITGASGFTGRHFIEAAHMAGHHCTAIGSSEDILGASRSLQVDIRNREALHKALTGRKFDAVLHLAAISFVAHGGGQEIYSTNVLGTVNLVDVLTEISDVCPRIVIASSGNIYGNSDILPITEECKYDPANDYAASKCAMEMALKVRYHGLNMAILRPFNYTGVGQAEHFLVPKIVNSIKARQSSIELGNLDVARDFSDVRDLVSVYLQLIENNERGVFNFCSGRATSLHELIQRCESISNHSIEVRVNPEFVRASEVKKLFGDDSKLRGVIGNYRKFDLDDTLRWMLAN